MPSSSRSLGGDTARRLLDAGWTGLIPVLPADARPAPGTDAAKVFAARGKAPGVYHAESGGWALMPRWTEDAPPPGWTEWPGVNVGLVLGRASGWACIDVDVTDPFEAEVICTEIETALPGAVRRIGAPPKAAYLVRIDPSEELPTKLRSGVYDRPDGMEIGQVEYLAHGQQVVVGGWHPMGRPYQWAGVEGPWGIDVRSAPVLSGSRAARMVEHYRDRWERSGRVRRTRRLTGTATPDGGPPPVDMTEHLKRIDLRDPAQRRAWLDEWCIAGSRHHATVALTAAAVAHGLDREEILSEIAPYRDESGRWDAQKAWQGAVDKDLGPGPLVPPPPVEPLAEGPSGERAPSWAETGALQPITLPSPVLIPGWDETEPEGPPMLLGDLFPRQTVGTLYGPDGLGKSTFTMAMLAHAALGLPYMGGRRPPTPLKSLVLMTEDPEAALRQRLWRVVGSLEGKAALADIKRMLNERLHAISLLELPQTTLAQLDRSSGAVQPTPLHGLVEAKLDEAAKAGDPYDVLVLDSLSDLHAINENDRAQVSQFVRLVGSIAARHDLFALLVGHPPKDGMGSGRAGDESASDREYSGSGAWAGKSRTRLTMMGPREREPRTVRRVLIRKSSYSDAENSPSVLLMMERGVPMDRTPTQSEHEDLRRQARIIAKAATLQFIRDEIKLGNVYKEQPNSRPRLSRTIAERAANGDFQFPYHKRSQIESVVREMLAEGRIEYRDATVKDGFDLQDSRGKPLHGLFPTSTADDGLAVAGRLPINPPGPVDSGDHKPYEF